MKLIILELYAWMDGGSITLFCKNEMNESLEIDFVQHVVWEVTENLNIPGRIYLNKELVDQRSKLEELIIKKIEGASYTNLEYLDQQILKESINYIKSEQYLLDAHKVQIIDK